jgi:hypothetical protein
MTELAAFRMIAADFAGFRAKRTGHVAVACRFAAMTAGRVWSSTMGITNSVYLLSIPTVNPDIAVFASMLTVASASQRCSAGCRTGITNIQRQFVITDSDFMFAMLYDLLHLDLTANFF